MGRQGGLRDRPHRGGLHDVPHVRLGIAVRGQVHRVLDVDARLRDRSALTMTTPCALRFVSHASA